MYIKAVGLRGLLYALWGKMTSSLVTIKINTTECKHPILVRVPSSDVPTYRHILKLSEYDFSVETAPKIIIDAGANIGLASVFFANRFPSATIIAIEPEQSNFKILTSNVAPYPNIIPLQAALWHKNEVINLVDPGLGKWGFMTLASVPKHDNSSALCHSVEAISMEKILHDFNIDKVDILKIDIEGAEMEVFQDSSPWIEKINSIIIELHEHMKPGCNRSFYCGSTGFENEWKQGENIYLSRGNYLKRPSS